MDAVTFYAEYRLPDGRYLTEEKQEEYTGNATILNAFRKVLEQSTSHRKKQGGKKNSKTEFWKKAAECLAVSEKKLTHSLPLNARRLQNRFNQYLKNGYESLISKTYMQRNAAKIDNDIKESLLIELMADPRNLNNTQIRNLYNIIADKMDWKTNKNELT
jgi:hypothetical protein